MALPISKEKIVEINSMKARGESLRSIAKHFSMCDKTVRKYLGSTNATEFNQIPESEAEAGRLDLPEAEHDGFGPNYLSRVGWWLILSDIHIPYHDTAALKIAVSEGQKRDAVGVVLNGDIIDAPGLSRFLKEPSVVQIKDAVAKLGQFFGWLRGVFPHAEIVWKCGNHEARLYAYLLANAPALFGLEALTWGSIAGASKHGIKVMEDDTQIIHLGKLPILHGHEFARAFAPPVNPARGLYLRAKTSAMCGHHHATSFHTEKDVKGKPIACWSTGCLCHLQPRYARYNNFNHGFAMVDVYKDGEFDVHNLRIFNGRVA